MKLFLTAILLSVASAQTAYGQEKGNSRVIISVSDTTGLTEKIRLAFAKADFQVKNLNVPDSIATFPRELKSMSGYAIAFANFEGGKVILTGYYTRRIISYYGVIKTTKGVNPIVYYKNGKLWPLLMKVANEIGGEVSYAD